MTTYMNSTDASRGQPLKRRAEQRVRELEMMASRMEPDDHNRRDIELAVFCVQSLLTGDDEHLSAAIAVEVNRWLEANKHLAEYHVAGGRRAANDESSLPPPRPASVWLDMPTRAPQPAQRAG